MRILADAAHPQLSGYSAAQIASLVDALHKVGHYEKGLYDDFAAAVKARFTEFETADLAKLIVAFTDNDHYEVRTLLSCSMELPFHLICFM